MSFRFMRVMVFFDLPTTTKKELNAYAKFRKFLLKNGFYMLQESVYCKLVLNHSSSYLLSQKVKSHAPSDGLIMLLSVTEKQFSKMDIIIGDKGKEHIDSTDRIVLL
ncbi:CRISPR-associated endonuclease Cas2 [Campylobacter geochelonis]|nr:CRISPR-associated endonuclease Cas2 [Campylobacter geochelonis]QKF70456.1 CRISPR/Cas system-associated endoribonuclease Cas2 [Campylobacter geochelonis]